MLVLPYLGLSISLFFQFFGLPFITASHFPISVLRLFSLDLSVLELPVSQNLSFSSSGFRFRSLGHLHTLVFLVRYLLLHEPGQNQASGLSYGVFFWNDSWLVKEMGSAHGGNARGNGGENAIAAVLERTVVKVVTVVKLVDVVKVVKE